MVNINKLVAYNNNSALKAALLVEIENHRAADAIIAGTYGRMYADGWKGCAVGCSLRSLDIARGREPDVYNKDHGRFETELGIPRILAKLEDHIFEGMPASERPMWPGRFAAAIAPGADLSMVWPRFAVWMLDDPEHGVSRFTEGATREKIAAVANLYRRICDGGEVTREEWTAAARATSDTPFGDAYNAAYAAYNAAYAAFRVVYVASATIVAADAIYAAYAADHVPYSAHFSRMANKLEELLRAVKP